MSLTLREICDNVLLELGFQTQSAYAGATTDSEKRIFALANREARVLSRYPWEKLKKSATITMATGTTSYALASDFRHMIADTAWAGAQNRKVDWPTSDEYWGFLQSFTGSTGIRYQVRQRDGELEFHHIVDGDTIRYEYVSDHPIEDNGGTSKARFTVDSDVWLLDDEAIQMGLKWRFLKSLGHDDWSVERQEYDRYIANLKGSEGGMSTLDLVRSSMDRPPYEPYSDLWADT